MRLYEGGSRVVELVDGEGVHVGKVPSGEAEQRAEEAGLDLVCVREGSIPVLKVMDYSKWKYEQSKKKRKERARAAVVPKVKETQLTVRIGAHDMKVKAKKAWGHLEKGDRVQAVVKLKGRERSHGYLADQVLEWFRECVEEVAEVPVQRGDISRQGHRVVVEIGIEK